MWYPKNGKKKPVKYEGPREVNDFKEYLKQNSSAYQAYLAKEHATDL